jgi:xylulokinase
MQSAGLSEVKQVRVTGGGAKSPLWRQIMADILGTNLVTVSSVEGAAYGAALLAATGAGVYPDIERACDATIEITGKTQPSQDMGYYEELYRLYRDLYPALKASFAGLGQLTS